MGKKVSELQKVTFQVSNFNDFRYIPENPGQIRVIPFMDGDTSEDESLVRVPGSRRTCPTLFLLLLTPAKLPSTTRN
jgi:hypothetical protein